MAKEAIGFDEAFDKLIGHEGGYSNDPQDPGGETNFGISKRSYPQEDIKGMSRERAKELYFRDFWQPLDEMSIRPTLRFHMFDTAVNSGMKTAIRLLQQTARISDVDCDGIWGPYTEKALRWVPDEKIVEWFNGRRLAYMTDLRGWNSFGKGWTRRIAHNLLLEG